MVKPDAVTLLTVPDAPPAAGPDRALDPPPPAVVEEDVVVVEVAVAFVEGDVAQPANSATTAHIDAAAIHPRLGFDSSRCGLVWRLPRGSLSRPNRSSWLSPTQLHAESVSPRHVRTLWATCDPSHRE
jgi:hypothetical protein